jgi:hypothetical protein
MVAKVRFLEEEKRLSGTDQQRRQNSSKASLGLAFREIRECASDPCGEPVRG